MSPSRAASTALSSETSSQGWATAVAMAGCLLGALRSGARTCRAAGRRGTGLSGIGRPQRLDGLAPRGRTALSIRPRRRRPSSGKRAACAEHLQQGVERGSAGVLARRAAAGEWRATARSSSRRSEEILVLQTCPSARPCSCGRSTGCMARIACRAAKPRSSTLPSRQADIDQGAQHRLGRPPTSKRRLELDAHLGLVGLAQPSSRSIRRAVGACSAPSPTMRLQQRRAVDVRGTSPRSWRRARCR